VSAEPREPQLPSQKGIAVRGTFSVPKSRLPPTTRARPALSPAMMARMSAISNGLSMQRFGMRLVAHSKRVVAECSGRSSRRRTPLENRGGKRVNHHFLPQVYLRQWRSGSELLRYRRNLPSGELEGRRYPPRTIAHEPDLYAIPSGSSANDLTGHDLEAKLAAEVDGRLAKVVAAFGSDYLHTARTVEEALASALDRAAKAGRWDGHARLRRRGCRFPHRRSERTPSSAALDRRRAFSRAIRSVAARSARKTPIMKADGIHHP
jgi:hypothetical protein